MTTTMLERLPELEVEPVYIGPTWTKNPTWTGEHQGERYVLPEHSLGWGALHWAAENLLADDSTEDDPKPFRFTFEQKRLLLWWYSIDEHGRFVWRSGVLQRLKGWGKDPIAAVISAIEFLGPCRFRGWTTKDRPDLGLVAGDPIGKEHPRAWIQIAAVSEQQTTNTMSIFPGLFSEACKKAHGMDRHSIGKTVIYAHAGSRRIEAVTRNPRTLEGGRPTFVLRNETHHWVGSNNGYEMAAVIERNATKSKDGAARVLDITNAYEPSEDSVAQRMREAYEAEAGGVAYSTGLFYDSIEAPPTAKLRPGAIPTGEYDDRGRPITREPTEEETRAYITKILLAVRGDAVWLDIPGIIDSILRRTNPPSRSRRFWYNQVVAKEDAWLDPLAIAAAIHPRARDARSAIDEADALRAGWLVGPTEPIVMFLDCSKSDDSTALIGCRLSDGYVFVIGIWQKPRGERGATWTAPRGAVDERVAEAFERFKIVGFWGDPSHTKDDDDDTRYWDPMFDRWHRTYSSQIDSAMWAVKTGDRQHAIMWDMTSPLRLEMFVAAAETFVSEMEHENDIEEYEPAFFIDGHPALVEHLRNAIKDPDSRYGVSLMKPGRESLQKIDLAVSAVGARMMRRIALNRDVQDEKPKAGRVWGAW